MKNANSRAGFVAGVVLLLLIGATAVFLSRFQRLQRLSEPGVKVVSQDIFDDQGKLAGTNAVYFPLELPPYAATNMPLTTAELNWLPKDTTYGRALYRTTNGYTVQMSAVLMGADRTSIHKPEYCLVGQGFRIIREQLGTIPIGGPVSYDLPVTRLTAGRETKLADGRTLEERALYVYWFVADGQVAAQHGKRMLSSAWELLTTGVTQRWAYISCFAFVHDGDEEKAYSEIEHLIASAAPQFQLVNRGTMSAKR
jgi:hypothetical protein